METLEELMTKAQQGDVDAFNAIVERTRPMLVRYLCHRGASLDNAEDIAQETYIRLWRSRDNFDSRLSKLSTFIVTIAKRVSIDDNRRIIGQGVRKLPQTISTESTPDIPDDSGNPYDLSELVLRAISTLPADWRRIMVLSAIEGKSNREIADITGITYSNVGYRLYCARKKLAEILSEFRK